MKKFNLPQPFNRVNRVSLWLIPFFSLSTAVPLVLNQWQGSDSTQVTAPTEQNSPNLPSSSQSLPLATPQTTTDKLPSTLPSNQQNITSNAITPKTTENTQALANKAETKPEPNPLDSLPSPVAATPKPITTTPSQEYQKNKAQFEQQSSQSVTSTPAEKTQAKANKTHNPSSPTKSKSKTTSQQPRQQQTQARAASYTPPKLEIRVALARDASNLNLGVSTKAYLFDSNNRQVGSLDASQGVVVNAAGNALMLNNDELPSVMWVQPTNQGLVYVGDRWYRGRLLLVSKGNSVLAVNYVDLEQYLYGVIGSEMHPTANPEALKAQAIAARSYALVHIVRPASDWYDLGATPRWQAYNGIHKEYQSTNNAVNATAGEILSYKGGIVESLYAATDEIVSRAHGGRGMSQTGAYGLADSGYNYTQILSYYYPGVTIAKLELQ